MASWWLKYTIGLFKAEPEFITVLADQTKERGGEVVLCCKTNIGNVAAEWQKDNEKLNCVTGKHIIKQDNNEFTLKIMNAEEEDEGKYTVTLKNILGSVSCSAIITIALREWREISKNSSEITTTLKKITISSDELKELRILLHGPVGAGKSSIINTIKSIFDDRTFINCLAAEGLSTSQTRDFQKYTVGCFTFCDLKGMESESDWDSTGDIINALKGHIKHGYKFGNEPIRKTDSYYNSSPVLSDKVHCLITVVPADAISLISNEVISKLRTIRRAASDLGIPQVVFMTKVDKACPMTKADLSQIYRSKKIKQKMIECSNLLTVPMNCIFPVKNYHEESQLIEELNCLMLDALTPVVHWANDYVKRSSET